MTRTLTCILCPRGCTLTVDLSGDTPAVSGNFCPKGAKYGADECINPTRTVTAVVRVKNREHEMLAVKTETPVAKKHIFDVMAKINAVTVDAPVHIGDVVLEDAYGSRIVAASDAL